MKERDKQGGGASSRLSEIAPSDNVGWTGWTVSNNGRSVLAASGQGRGLAEGQVSRQVWASSPCQ
jgi:hypothetical protein